MEHKENTILEVLWQTGQFESKSEIKRLADQKAIFMQVGWSDTLLWKEETIFKIGKKKFIAII